MKLSSFHSSQVWQQHRQKSQTVMFASTPFSSAAGSATFLVKADDFCPLSQIVLHPAHSWLPCSVAAVNTVRVCWKCPGLKARVSASQHRGQLLSPLIPFDVFVKCACGPCHWSDKSSPHLGFKAPLHLQHKLLTCLIILGEIPPNNAPWTQHHWDSEHPE